MSETGDKENKQNQPAERNIKHMKTQIASMLKGLILEDDSHFNEYNSRNKDTFSDFGKSEKSDDDEKSEKNENTNGTNSGKSEETQSNEAMNFDEFPEDLFNADQTTLPTNDSTNQSQITFTRQNFDSKPQTMKAPNATLQKNQNLYGFGMDSPKRDLKPNQNGPGSRISRRNSKTVVDNNHLLNNFNNFYCPNTVYNNNMNNIIFLNNPGMNFNQQMFIPKMNNMNMSINNINAMNMNMNMNNMNSISNINAMNLNNMNYNANNNGEVRRGSLFKRTFIPQGLNANVPGNVNSFNAERSGPMKRPFGTVPPHFKNSSGMPLEIEMYLNELEVALNRAGFINYSIFMNIKPKLLSLIKTQTGSRILQNYLPKTPQQIISLIYSEIYDKANLLLLDPYANYFCLKLFCCLNKNERISYLNLIVKNIVTFSVNKIATYPIQCIVGHLITKEEKEIVIEPINKNLKKLALDIYGTHVLEKIILCLEPEYCKNLIRFILDNFVYLANHVNGLCLAKKILMMEYKKENFQLLHSILVNHCLDLIENPYGNYALQIVIDYWAHSDVIDIISKILGHCTELSMMKYSSNVIERCIQKSEIFLNCFINETCFEKKSIGTLIKNSYGNYVIQTALKCAKNGMKISLINSIESNLNILGEKKLINKWKSIIASNIIECVNNGNNISNIAECE